ncbi:GIY-YIG nuclease family protein [Nitrospira defluvii]|nr:GIY-YIG nuclease family protein [Nitrospira defluvii]
MKSYSGIVYKICNKENGKLYIGQTIQSLKSRKKDHRGCLDKLSHLALYRAFRKYGFENFEWEVIHQAKDKADLDKMEKYYIQHYNTMSPRYGYNLTYGGEGGKHPLEVREKISDSLKGRVFSEITRKKLSKSLKRKYTKEKSSWWGRKHTEDEKQKMSKAQRGSNNHNFGKKASEATRRKMSEARKGEKHWNHKRVMCIETKTIYISAIDAFEKTGIDNSSIGKSCKGVRLKAGNFTWKYID